MNLKLLHWAYSPKEKRNEWIITGKGGEKFKFPSPERIWELGPSFLGSKFMGVMRGQKSISLYILPKTPRKKIKNLANAIIAETTA